MNKIPAFLFLLFLSSKLFGQANFSIELLKLDSYESKINYYNKHINNIKTLNTVKELLSKENREEHRLELLLFYLKLQARFDISIGKSEAYTALRLAEQLDKPLQKATAFQSLSTVYGIELNNDSSLFFLNNAFEIANKIDDPVLESFCYYHQYHVYKYRGNNDKAIISLLRSVELADKYAGPTIRNERLNHFFNVNLELGQLSLAEKVMNQIDVNHLTVNRQSNFYVNKAKIYELKNQQDSSEWMYR